MLPRVADEEMLELSAKRLIETLAHKLQRSCREIKPAVNRAIDDWLRGVFGDGDDDAAVASPDAAGNNSRWGSELYDAGAGGKQLLQADRGCLCWLPGCSMLTVMVCATAVGVLMHLAKAIISLCALISAVHRF
jgi:hypothetical protein